VVFGEEQRESPSKDLTKEEPLHGSLDGGAKLAVGIMRADGLAHVMILNDPDIECSLNTNAASNIIGVQDRFRWTCCDIKRRLSLSLD
jgi:hypothetical protein